MFDFGVGVFPSGLLGKRPTPHNCKLFTKPQLSGGGVITAVYCGVAHFAVEAGTAGE